MDSAPDARFVMHGAREVLAMAGAAIHLEQQIIAIEDAVANSPNLAVDLARTLIETVCKTILVERGDENCHELRIKDLLRRTYTSIQLLPDSKTDSLDTLEGLRHLLEHLDEAIHGISRIRHAEGLASHGKDAYFTPLETVQAEFVARAADALVSFLYKSHKRYSGDHSTRELEYDDYREFNVYLDSSHGPVVLFGFEYRASEILFFMDRPAYLDLLANFPGGETDEVEEDSLDHAIVR